MFPQINRSQSTTPRTANRTTTTTATPAPAIATASVQPAATGQSAARARLCCDWRNPTNKLIAAYGLPVTALNGSYTAAAAHDIQNALARLGPPTQDHDTTGRLFARALIDGHATKFAAVMTLARHQVINLNNPLLTTTRASMLLEVINKPGASRSGIDFPGNEFISVSSRVATMVALGADPDHPHFSGALPLEVAWNNATPEGDEAARALLHAGANPIKEGSDGLTMLHRAALNNNLHLIRSWRAAGLAENLPTSQGRVTPLMLAAFNNHPDAIRLLLADSNANINEAGEGNHTALHLAAHANSLEAAEALLAGGANVIDGIFGGETPYSMALAHEMNTGDGRMAALLQEHALASGIPEQLLGYAANLRH
ncbi:MAG: hypothetical protein ACI802_003820 [Candidatus Paceibacteria bacterium]